MKDTTRRLIFRLGIPVAILGVSILVGVWLASMREEPARRTPAPRTRIVDVRVVTLDTVRAEIAAYGRLTSAQPVELYSEVAGTLVEGNIPFKPAQAFARGDLLLKVDDRQARLDLNSAKSELLNALASVLPEIKVDFPDQFAVWQDYFDRVNFNDRLPDLPETANQKIKMFLSRFNVYRLYFTARNLEIQLDKHRFYAPFDGSIVNANLREGSSVRSGTLVGQIINLEDLEIEVPVAVADIPWLSRDQRVSFTSTELPGEWTGRVKRVGNNIDSRTQTVPVYLTVDQSDAGMLYDGIFLEAEIPGEIIAGAVRIPRLALYNDTYVYVVDEGKLDRRAVEIARRETDHVLVSSGLQTGDTLVVELLQGVATGMPAKPRIGRTITTTPAEQGS
ncbi:efflux RND transporter periplasmic adaptor subunit [candidate division GN15 bacterium]|nr:efflux RND transporter periplasmic adaptor subunit [candidate division GN15 bacterium]